MRGADGASESRGRSWPGVSARFLVYNLMVVGYYIRHGGKVKGPYPLETLRRAHREGRLPPSVEIGETPELFYPFTSLSYLFDEGLRPPPAPAAVPSPRKPAAAPAAATVPQWSQQIAKPRARSDLGESQGASGIQRKRPATVIAATAFACLALLAFAASLISYSWVQVEGLTTLREAGSLSFHPLGVWHEQEHGGPPVLMTYPQFQMRIPELFDLTPPDSPGVEGYGEEIERTAAVGIIALAMGFLSIFCILLSASLPMIRKSALPTGWMIILATLPFLSLAVVLLYPFAGVVAMLGRGNMGILTWKPGIVDAISGLGILVLALVFLLASNNRYAINARRGRSRG